MAVLASIHKWIPQDDLLLKNAVEAGASLEALAKGAVRFSRKFTVRELQDRWHSLLYDPVISAEASARMVEYELSVSCNPSKSNGFGNSKERVEVHAKRKFESVRKQYYAMRKRIRGENCNSFDLSFLGAPNVKDCIGFQDTCVDILHHVPPHIRRHDVSANAVDGTPNAFPTRGPNLLEDDCPDGVTRNDCFNGIPEKVPSLTVKESVKNDDELILEQKNVQKNTHPTLGDNLVDFGNCSEVEDIGPSHGLPDMPIWKTIEDISAPAMPMDMSLGDKGQGPVETLIHHDDVDGEKISSSGYNVVHSKPILKSEQPGDGINSSAASEVDYVELSGCILNLENEEDELLFMDDNGKDTTDDNLNSILLNSPNGAHEDVVPNGCEPQTLISNTCHAISAGACTTGLDVIADPSKSGHGDQHSICSSEVDMPSSTSVPNPVSAELHDGETVCTLNTEDPDIPCNDDICLPITFASSAMQPSYKEANYLASSSTNQRNSEQEISLKKKDGFTFSQTVGPHTMLQTKHPIVGFGVTPGFSDGNCPAADCKEATNVHADLSQGRSAHATQKSATDGTQKENNAPATDREHALLHVQPGSTKRFLEPEANSPTLDQEESDDEEDIPCFSDIEKMILEMDLCPNDQDSYISREVSRYQHDDTKRKIIRLEQCARSSMQRAIASQGALAVFYGSRLKQYIKKTEVILGRATNDIEVDIDLGKEGRANKISRRQALIKMEGDGSFFLKNLGKNPIFVNGKEIARGQLLSLNSSSLIEIKGMSFVFEMNHKSVRQYVANVAKRSKQKNPKFEWSPGGVHE